MTPEESQQLVEFEKRLRAATTLYRKNPLGDDEDPEADVLGVADELGMLAHPIIVVRHAS